MSIIRIFWVSQNEKGYVIGEGDKEIAQLGKDDEKTAKLFASSPELLSALNKCYFDATTFLNEGTFKEKKVWGSDYIVDAIKRSEGN